MPEFILQNFCLRSSNQGIISWREWSVALMLGHFVLWELQHQSCGTFCSSVHLVPVGSNTRSIFFLLKFLGCLNMVMWSPGKACVITFRKSWMLLIWVYVSLSHCHLWNVLLTQTAQQYVTVVWAADARGMFASLFIDFSLLLHFLPCLFFSKDLLAWLAPPLSLLSPVLLCSPIDSTLYLLNTYSTYSWLCLPFCKLRSSVALAACGCIQPQSFLLGQ